MKYACTNLFTKYFYLRISSVHRIFPDRVHPVVCVYLNVQRKPFHTFLAA